MMDEEVGQLAAQPWYGQGQGAGEISALVRSAARDCQGDSQRLLSLLRLLESLHREIRIHQFEPSLPQTRNALYQLLRDMEETGGWPYIERMRLQTFLNYFQLEESRHERGNFPE